MWTHHSYSAASQQPSLASKDERILLALQLKETELLALCFAPVLVFVLLWEAAEVPRGAGWFSCCLNSSKSFGKSVNTRQGEPGVLVLVVRTGLCPVSLLGLFWGRS